MRGFLIDANLPYRFNLWHGEGYEHVFDHDDAWSDTQIWDHARNHDLVIVTKGGFLRLDNAQPAATPSGPPAYRQHETTGSPPIFTTSLATHYRIVQYT